MYSSPGWVTDSSRHFLCGGIHGLRQAAPTHWLCAPSGKFSHNVGIDQLSSAIPQSIEQMEQIGLPVSPRSSKARKSNNAGK